jgi:hypothetical protein
MIFGMTEICGLQTQVSTLIAMQALGWFSRYATGVGFTGAQTLSFTSELSGK